VEEAGINMITMPKCSICGNTDHFMLGRGNLMRCACCRNYMEDEDYIEITEAEYEIWKNEKPGRV
jgi:hypothetical protein